MTDNSFTYSFHVDNSPEEVFHAIQNIRGWWSEAIIGETQNVGDEFTYHYKDIHNCKLKLVEKDPPHHLSWLVTDNYFNFTKNHHEWVGSHLVFDIREEGGKTWVTFTHDGLVPQEECYETCEKAWTGYIGRSLVRLIVTGKGEPNSIEDSTAE